jgi:hypothetical protein
MRTFLLLIASALIFVSCQSKSRVTNFEYKGFGDTIFAVINGEIYEDNNLAFTPLKSVIISVDSIGKSTKTDKDGKFEIGLNSGKYKITVNKKGYQTIRIENYISVPDQISKIKIILEKGNSTQTYNCPKVK